MATMPAKIVKGRIFEKIDKWVNGVTPPVETPAARAAKALNQLNNTTQNPALF